MYSFSPTATPRGYFTSGGGHAKKCFVPAADVVRFLQQKCQFSVDGVHLSCRLQRLGTAGRKEDGTYRLVSNLMGLRNQDTGAYCAMTRSVDGRMHSTVWSISEWKEDYYQYGVIPGISIDCKYKGNEFLMSLITVSGRTNCGRVFTAMMGFLVDETEVTFR